MSVPTRQGRRQATDGGTQHRLGGVLAVYGPIFSATLRYVIAYVLLYVASQITLVVALLLPWKILIIVGANRIPRTLPAFLLKYDARELVPILSAGALGFFLLHIISEIGVRHICDRAVETVLSRNQKIGLFDRHREQAARYYRRLLRLLAVAICCAMILCWLAWAYPSLLLGFVIYLCAGMAAAYCWRASRSLSKYRLPTDLVVKTWWGGGFLYMVGWAINDYWQGNLPGLTTAFISVLLVRQALLFVAAAYRDLLLLNHQKAKVSALFDARTPWHPRARVDGDFHALLAADQRKHWIDALLRQYHASLCDAFDVHCHPVENGRVVYITATGLVGTQAQSFLLKLFHQSQQDLAAHEREILQVASASWPAPPFLGAQGVAGHSCLIFGWNAAMQWMSARDRAASMRGLRAQLLACDLPETVVARYDRGRPHLSQRLQAVDWRHLQLFSSSRPGAGRCQEMEGRWPDILNMLGRLPRQLVLPMLGRRRMASGGDKGAVMCNWSRWRWEPVGAGWPVTAESLTQLEAALAGASRARGTLSRMTAAQAHYVSALYEFERFHAARDYAAALTLVGALHEGMAGFCARQCMPDAQIAMP
ncbi:hypothetical protein [Sphingobium aquiterrae]|uniref:hypothetical protein n=1 Tax=Sphingobium aquiterrae TaxID=2038656 RepID=UPI003016F10F